MIENDFRTPCPVHRRGALRLLAGVPALLLGGRVQAQTAAVDVPTPACVVTPAQTEGPYFVDERMNRDDIRVDPTTAAISPGSRLALDLRVAGVSGGRCAPLADAIVDLWQCDALGDYSGVGAMRGRRFLRGFQRTDAHGRVRFTTIYPGAYPGRAVHIHFKVRASGSAGPLEFTSQLYFDDTLTDRVHAAGPYAAVASRRTHNARDGLYRQGGRELTLDVREAGDGYATTYTIGMKIA